MKEHVAVILIDYRRETDGDVHVVQFMGELHEPFDGGPILGFDMGIESDPFALFVDFQPERKVKPLLQVEFVLLLFKRATDSCRFKGLGEPLTGG